MKSPIKRKDRKEISELRKKLSVCKTDVKHFRNGEELMRQSSEQCEESLYDENEKSYKKYINKNAKSYKKLFDSQRKRDKGKDNDNSYEPEKCKQCTRDLAHYKNVSAVNELFIYRISMEFRGIDPVRYKKFLKEDKEREKKDIKAIEKGVDPEKLFKQYGKK
jgi:hypothetical protein